MMNCKAAVYLKALVTTDSHGTLFEKNGGNKNDSGVEPPIKYPTEIKLECIWVCSLGA